MLLGLAAVTALSFHATTPRKPGPLRLGDVADVAVIPRQLRTRAAALVLIDRPALKSGQRLAVADLASRARALLPALGAWLPATSREQVIVEDAPGSVRTTLALSDATRNIRRGDAGVLRVDTGIATIERPVRLAQDGEVGANVFVRTSDGKIVAAHCCVQQ